MTHDQQGRHQPPPQQQPPTARRALGLAAALTLTLLAAGTGALAAAGALLPSSQSRSDSAAAAAAPPPVVAVQPGDPAGRTPPPTAPPPATRQPAGARLTAFGATIQYWDANHRRDPAVGGGAYLPDPALGGDGRLADRYVRVLPLNGLILQYTVQLPRNTPLATASTRALTELPSDLRPVWQQQRGNCAQAAYRSAVLAQNLADIGDPRGAVLIEFRSGVAAGSHFDAGDVTSATLSALDAPTPADGPLC
jgi:hypothetical protein